MGRRELGSCCSLHRGFQLSASSALLSDAGLRVSCLVRVGQSGQLTGVAQCPAHGGRRAAEGEAVGSAGRRKR